MQLFILICVCIEAIILSVLAIKKKLTKKVFLVVSCVTLVFCLMGTFALGASQTKTKDVNEKKYIYMAARLTENGYIGPSIQALSQVEDTKRDKYSVRLLRALNYNLEGMYQTVVDYLAEDEREAAEEICEASQNGMIVDYSLTDEVVDEVIDSLKLSDKKKEQYDAELQLRYMVTISTTSTVELKDYQKDAWTLTREAMSDLNWEEAYEIMLKEAAKGDLRDIIIVSDMYAYGYDERSLADKDEGYEQILQEITEAQIQYNLAALDYQPPQGYYYDTEVKTDEQKAYEQAEDAFYLAQQKLYIEGVKRSINYMEANKPIGASKNVAYQLQMAYLHFEANDPETANSYLARIFAKSEMDQEQWLGLETYLLRESFIASQSSGSSAEFDMIYSNLMSSLSQGFFGGNYLFRSFVYDYLTSIYSGLQIGEINVDNFPQVTMAVSVSDPEIELTERTITITDTEEKIKKIEIEQREVPQLSICFVLDRSGSMDGNSMRDAKLAIGDSVMSLDESTSVGLVSFDDQAEIECNMTNSPYLVTSVLDNIDPRGGTNIALGLKTGGEALRNATGEKIIILLSDGYDGGSAEINNVISDLAMQNIKVFTIGLEGCDEMYLSNIATRTGGSFVSVTNTNKLDQVYAELQQYLTNTYYITYTVTDESEDRITTIELKNKLVRAEKVYTLDEEEIQINIEQPVDGMQTSDFFQQSVAY